MAEPGVHVSFELFPVVNGVLSKEAGREVCVDKEYVRIRVAGNDKEEFFGPVNDQIKDRFPSEYESWKKGNDVPLVGTPIQNWPQLTVSQVRNLQSLGVRTVEDMATLSDVGLQKVGMGARKLQDDARKFLSLAQAAADVGQLDELREANANKDLLLAQQAESIATLQAQMAELLKPKEPEVVEEAPRRRRATA
jgi:hypothetical protein